VIRSLVVLCLAGQLAACAGMPAPLEYATPNLPEGPATSVEAVVVSEVVDESEEGARVSAGASTLLSVRSRRAASPTTGDDAQARVRLAKESPNDIDALARMDRIVARHERDARQAASGVCGGCLGAFQAPQYPDRIVPLPATSQIARDRSLGRTGAMAMP